MRGLGFYVLDSSTFWLNVEAGRKVEEPQTTPSRGCAGARFLLSVLCYIPGTGSSQHLWEEAPVGRGGWPGSPGGGPPRKLFI